MSKLTGLAVVVVALAWVCETEIASAAIFVAPSAQTTTEGNGNNHFPFGSGNPMRYQQVYGAGDFAALAGPEFITQIAFRPDASFGDAFVSTLSNVQINFSTTSASPDGLSATFASNVGSDETTVFHGPLSLSSSDTGPANGPKVFDILITLVHFRRTA